MKLNKLKDSLVGLAIVLFFNGCNSLDISNLWNYDAELNSSLQTWKQF